MPNHVKNRITLIGTPEEVKQVFERYNTHYPETFKTAHDGTIICKRKTDGVIGWYNETTQLIETREEGKTLRDLDLWERSIDPAWDHFPDFNKIKPQPPNIFRGDLSSEKEAELNEAGIPHWYGWNIENWGTKWNSYSCECEAGNIFTFETAWSSVVELMLMMSKQNPTVKIIYEWADEDFGYNCGRVELENGKILNEFYPEGGSNEAYELALDIRPNYREYFEKVDGEWEWKEE